MKMAEQIRKEIEERKAQEMAMERMVKETNDQELIKRWEALKKA